jgi:hypothetical protein
MAILAIILTGGLLLAAGVYGFIRAWPSERHRWIFSRRPGWLVRWLCGDLSLTATFWSGGPLVVLLIWWVCRMGYSPGDPVLHSATALWLCGLGVALVNAARKSRLSRVGGAGIAVVAAGLLLGAGALAWGGLFS